MRQDLEDQLVQEFPKLYSHAYPSVGDGWFQIIYDLSSKLERLIEQFEMTEDDFEPPYASQIKEKFGTLRFYLSHGTDEMFALIQDAENKSEVTCEQCGEPGKIRAGGWIECRCDHCQEQHEWRHNANFIQRILS